MHIHYLQKRRIYVKYYIGGHKILNDILLAFQDMRYKALIANRNASGWAFYIEKETLVKHLSHIIKKLYLGIYIV